LLILEEVLVADVVNGTVATTVIDDKMNRILGIKLQYQKMPESARKY